jgi:hypothetical protein
MDFYFHWLPGKKKSEVDGLDDPEYQETEEAENQRQKIAKA